MKKCDIKNIPENYKYCLVPGCKLYDDKNLIMPPILIKRLEIIKMIHEARPDIIFILSGTKYDTKAMENELKNTIPKSNIIIDKNGYNTLKSIINIKSYISDKNILLLTSNFHQKRLNYVARKIDFSPLVINTDRFEKKPFPIYVLREKAAYIKNTIEIKRIKNKSEDL